MEKNSFITSKVMNSSSRNPIEIAMDIMRNPEISIHGPEHHYLVAAVLLGAYRNCDQQIALDNALQLAQQRAKGVPGGACGSWGSCGAGIATGIFASIITQATPFSEKEWSLANQATSEALKVISENGGPRCCKRDSFLAIRQATKFVKENLGVPMELPERIKCEFSDKNEQCRKKNCLFFVADMI